MGIIAVWENSRELLEVLPKVVVSALIHSGELTTAWRALDGFVESFVRNLKMKLNPVMRLVHVPVCPLSWLGLHMILNYWLTVRG